MPKKRVPTNILALRGSFRAHPERAKARASEPHPADDLDRAPAHLTDDQRRAYDELARKAHDGSLSSADSVLVELAAVLLARIRSDGASANAALFGRLQSALGALGMTPVDRSRIQVRQKDVADDPYAEFRTAD